MTPCRRIGDAGEVHHVRRLPLYWRVCLINGAVFAAGTLALVLSPASVSRTVVASEAAVLVVGLVVMLVTNGLLLRSSLAPVDRVAREMQVVELSDGLRLEEPTTDPGARLVRGYNSMLDRLESERSESSARALAAQESERHRIAQELHDQVGQDLTVVLLGLKRLDGRVPPDVAAELELLRESVRTGLEDVGRVARQLRPGVLDDLGLASALAALCSDVAGHSRLAVRRTVSPALPELSPQQELVVYRVAQEALTNVARHAGASTVTVSLTRLGREVVLEVADDGTAACGLRPGSGLAGMQERAMLVGGTVTVTGGAGSGTSVRLTIPVVGEQA
ncbi:sensor histidine kinase [Nocardioides sp.]|uniref:sensor histidine kinase n=1 Tax=Nocardioides sp. TaxID=35761 RepID=UPI002ED13A59